LGTKQNDRALQPLYDDLAVLNALYPQLFLGDSVVRDLIWTWCGDFIKEKRVLVNLDDNAQGEKTQGWLCQHPTYNLSMINGFIYGMTNYSRYDLVRNPDEIISREWPGPPWGFEERLPELKEQYDRFNVDIIFVRLSRLRMPESY